ncbi:MAG: SPOR domain-containing protein [Marinilabiliaceae bacterium]
MEQYLLELIKNNNRVIVPNFGAFIVSRDAGTTVLFNNFLSFNDGLLINHVSSQEGIDTTQATRKVSEFVEKIKQDLDDNGEYTIDKLGRFTKDQNGILRFTQDPKVSELIPDKPDKEAKPDKGPDRKEDSALLDLDSDDRPEAQSGIRKKTEKKPAEKPTATASASKAQTPGAKPQAQAQKSPQKPAGKPPQQTEKAKMGAKSGATGKKPPVTPPPPKNKDRKSGLPPWAIALLILIPVILIALYFLLWRGDTKQQKTVEDKTQITDTVKEEPQIDSAAIEQAKKEEEERLQKEEEQQRAKEKEQQAKQGPRHHIIVGSFSKESNAIELVEKLKNEGFDSAMTFKHNNLTLVSADSFKSLSDAYDAQQKILQEQRMENWILTRR